MGGRFIVVSLAIVILSSPFWGDIALVTAQEPETRSLEGVTISPALIERDVIPGEELSLSFKITNNDPTDDELYLAAVDFGADPREGGSPHFYDEVSSSAYKSTDPEPFSSWIQLTEEKIFIGAGERREFSFTIIVPEDAEPGSHYGAIVLSRQDPANPQGLAVGATLEIGTLIFTKVAGEVFETGQALSFATSRRWYEEPPVTLAIRFENTGNVHTKPTGVIEINNMAGVKEAVLQINPSFGSVLPGSIRRFEEDWNPARWLNVIPRMGRYRAEGLLSYGLPSTTEKLGTVDFWLIHWRFLAKVAAAISAILLVFILFLRLYARRVISGHVRQKTKRRS